MRNRIADVTEAIGITPRKLVQLTSTPESIYFLFPGGGIVSSSVCENDRPAESARTVARPDIRMLNAAAAHPQPVAHHENYFRESPAPDTCPTTMEAGFAIVAWDVLIIDEEPMPCHATLR
jgi:hypothetical protein